MKKTLTENISRYDDKMRLRLDKKTIRAFFCSLLPAVVVGWVLCRISAMIGLPIAVMIFLACMLFQIGMVDGMQLSDYAKEILRQLGRRKLYYLYTDRNRISMQQSDMEGANKGHAKKQKQKKK